jgi:hypothetical protein
MANIDYVLVKQRNAPEDSTTVLSSELLSDCVKINVLEDYISKCASLSVVEDLIARINKHGLAQRDYIEKALKVNNVIIMSGMMNIKTHSDVEKVVTEEGSFYYNEKGQFRILTNNGWKTIKLED